MYSFFDSTIEVTDDSCAVSLLSTIKRSILIIEEKYQDNRLINTYEFRKSEFLKNDYDPIDGVVEHRIIDGHLPMILSNLDLSHADYNLQTWQIDKVSIRRLTEQLHEDVKNPPRFLSINMISSSTEGMSIKLWIEKRLNMVNISIPPDDDPYFLTGFKKPKFGHDKLSRDLINAVINKEYMNMEDCIKKGVNINSEMPNLWLLTSILKPIQRLDDSSNKFKQLTPLMIATENSDLKAIKILVAAGADIDKVIEKGGVKLTAMDLALAHGNMEVIQYFYKNDAKHLQPIPIEILSNKSGDIDYKNNKYTSKSLESNSQMKDNLTKQQEKMDESIGTTNSGKTKLSQTHDSFVAKIGVSANNSDINSMEQQEKLDEHENIIGYSCNS
jgi:hypothetical protein